MNSVRSALAVAVLLACVGPAAAQTVLAVSSWVPPGHHINASIRAWCSEVEQGTAGRVKCDMLAKPVAPPQGALNAVRNGLADFSFTVAAYNSEPLPIALLVSVPFTAGPNATGANFSVAYQRIHDRHMARFEEYKGVKLITVSSGTPQQIVSTGKVLKTVDDFKGMKILVGSKWSADLASALGAQPVVKPASQLYEMFSGGIVDATFNPVETVKSFKLTPFVKSVTMVPGGINFGAAAFYMSDEKWKKLSKDDQAVLMAAGGEKLARRLGAGFDAEDRDALALLQAAGVPVTAAPELLVRGMAERTADIRKALIAEARAKGLSNAEQVLLELRAEIDKVAADKP